MELELLLISFIIPFIFWLFSPQWLKERLLLLAKKIFCKKIDCENLRDNLDECQLLINNDEYIAIEKYVLANRYVFFPVVPKNAPSIIHLTFIDVILRLERLGLKVIVFVFDDYYRRISLKDENTTKLDISNFVKELLKRGIHRRNIKLESNINKKVRLAKKIYSRILDLSASLSIGDMNAIRSQTAAYIDNNSCYLKHQKILFNLAYLSIFKKIGFILSGEDELYLWQRFIDLEMSKDKTSIKSKLIILNIERMKNSQGEITNIWNEANLGVNGNKQNIKTAITTNCSNINFLEPDCEIFYLLKKLYFLKGKKLTITEKHGDLHIDSIEKLIEYCREHHPDDLSDNFINKLTAVIYDILHGDNIKAKQGK